jgi:hypothetical protein
MLTARIQAGNCSSTQAEIPMAISSTSAVASRIESWQKSYIGA